MKVFLTGASGLLGRSVYERFSDNNWTVCGISFKRTNPAFTKLNLLDKEAVTDLLMAVRPDVIVHCAAERFLDRVEKDFRGAYRLNVNVSAHLAELAKTLNVPLLYVSTDYVFDGDYSPYKETDEPKPINEYGRMKLLGERVVLLANPKNIVLRIPVLYGPVESLDESAVTCLLTGLKKCQNNNEVFKVSNYELRNPSSVFDIAHIIYNLVEKKIESGNDIAGIYQWCGKETFTKYDMVAKMAKLFNMSMEHVVPVNEQGRSKGRVKRPFNTLLDVSRIDQLGIGTHTQFEDGIKSVLANWID